MLCSDEIREMLGPYVDGEGSPEVRAAIEAHVCTCRSCRCEIGRLRALGGWIKAGGSARVPPGLWQRIERELASAHKPHGAPGLTRLRSIFAAAACIVLAVGGGSLILTQGLGTRAEAATVDFSVLLDGVSADAEGAFRQFVQHYKGRQVTAPQARRHASQLDFELPTRLPGGFELEEAFTLQIGETPAAAATYRRSGEFIGTIFHRAIHPEDYGTHRDHACVVGQHRGHRVDVGEWRLVHVTDATTCHCVLSRLDETRELPAILHAVAPEFQAASDHPHP